jgi:hypothetical protein
MSGKRKFAIAAVWVMTAIVSVLIWTAPPVASALSAERWQIGLLTGFLLGIATERHRKR